MFNAAKDALASAAAKRYLNTLITRYGKLEELTIDSRKKTMKIVCSLEGESEPVLVDIGRYDIERTGSKTILRFSSFTCSRPWAQSLLHDFARNRDIELPPWAASAL